MTTLEERAPEVTVDPVDCLVGALSRIQTVAGEMIAAVGRNRPIATRDQLRLAAGVDDVLAAVEQYQSTATVQCTGERYAVNPDFPGELVDVHHDGPCPAHVDLGEPLATSYHPERMGYLSELRHGDRALFAGGWREVATRYEHPNGFMVVRFTDHDMDPLIDRGTHSLRIQKVADEQEADALHRRDTGGL